MNLLNSFMMILLLYVAMCLLGDSKLLQVVSVSRHGARYHQYSHGNSSQTNPLYTELTAVGMRQLQKFGQMIRKEYVDQQGFLKPTYDPHQIQVFATPVNRTQESISSLLYGLYPPATGPKLSFVDKQWHLPPYSNKTDISEQNFAFPFGYQPIKVKNDENIAIRDCPRYSQYLKINMERLNDQIQEMMTTYKPFLTRLAAMYNFSVQNSTIKTFLEIFDVVHVDLNLGRPLPPELTKDDYKNLIHFANWYFYMAMGGNNTAMTNSGKLKKIFSVFDTRTRVPDAYPLKWTFISGHDVDVLALHLAMNLSSFTCIEELYRKGQTSALNCEQGGNYFATNLIFELHSDDDIAFYVKVRSNGKYVKLCGKDSEGCDYYTFKNLLKGNVLSNIQEVCGKKMRGRFDIQQD